MTSDVKKLDRWSTDQQRTIIWMDECYKDFDGCKTKFSKNRSIKSLTWEFYPDQKGFSERIQNIDNNQSVVVVSSGRLIRDCLDQVASSEQIHSIYIYCNKKEKYSKWQNDYEKVRGIFDEPIAVCNALGSLFDKDNWIQSSQDKNKFVSFDQISIQSICCLIDGQMHSFSQANLCWKVRQSGPTSAKLPAEGKGTIEFRLWKVNRFQIILSNQQSRNESAECGILIDVESNEISLSTIDGRQNSHRTTRYRTNKNRNLFLPIVTNDCYRFWVSFDHSRNSIQFGFGEVRPRFRVHGEILEKHILEKVSFLHFLGVDQQSNVNQRIFSLKRAKKTFFLFFCFYLGK